MYTYISSKSNRLAYMFLVIFLSHLILPSIVYGSSTDEGDEDDEDAGQSINYWNDSFVDKKTGAFNYTVDIMDVLGPEGDYGIDMTYVSGIKVQQESDLVGLGWNLNIGSIDRTLIGLPDDYSNAQLSVKDNFYNGFEENDNLLYNPVGGGLCNTTSPENMATYFIQSFMDTTNGWTSAYGSLKGLASNQNVNGSYYDSYSLLDPTATSFYQEANPNAMLAGSLPAYDKYMVTVPEIQGSIEPVCFENPSLHRNIVKTATDTVLKYKNDNPFTVAKPQFRYKYDFSNSFKVVPTNQSVSSSSVSFTPGTSGLGYSYTGPDNTYGYNNTQKKLAGSLHVEYYNNEEIANGTAVTNGLIKYQPLNDANRNSISFQGLGTFDVSKQVGAFTITDIEGNNYHFALPVYVYNSLKYIGSPSNKSQGRINKTIKFLQAYASKWLLTSVTGQDFVDRNSNGYADESDTGYWMNVSYGKYMNNAVWRSPYKDYKMDFQGAPSYAAARTEVYCPDAVYTRTHTALLCKSVRLDGKFPNDTISGGQGTISALRLDSVMLHDNASIKSALSTTSIHQSVESIKATVNNGYLDNGDLNVISTAKSIYTAALKFDYSLCPSTYNTNANGKLTLKEIVYKGSDKKNVAPPLKFYYELPSPQTAAFSSTAQETICICSNNNFKAGDIVKYTVSGIDYYLALLYKTSTGSCTSCNEFKVNKIGFTTAIASSGTITQTKNPRGLTSVGSQIAYFDNWGYFKSDFTGTSHANNYNIRVTDASAPGTDAWSLRRITSSTGANLDINYESNSYATVAYNTANNINIKSIIGFKRRTDNVIVYSNNYASNAYPIGDATGDWYRIFIDNNDSLGVSKYFAVNDSFSLSSICLYRDATRTIPYSDSTKAGVGRFKIIAKGLDASRGLYLDIQFTGRNNNLYSIESENPLRFPYAGNTNTTLNNIFPSGSRSTASHLLVHYGSFIVLDNYNVNQSKAFNRKGAGTRVSALTFSNPDNGEYYTTRFNYNNSFSTSTGSLPFEPKSLDNLTLNVYYSTLVPFKSPDFYNQYDVYFNSYLLNAKELLTAARFCPAPRVMYQCVTTTKHANGLQKNVYTKEFFKPFERTMISSTYLNAQSAGLNTAKTIKITDLTSSTGNLLSMQTYEKNSNSLLSEEVYNYDNRINFPNDQGILEQVYNEHRIFYPGKANQSHLGVVTVLRSVPNVLLSTESKSYHLSSSDKVYNNAFDFYSGKVTELVTIDANNVASRTIITPAYKKYTGMGVKMAGASNKNILSPECAIYTYKVSATNFNTKLGLLNTEIHTWNNQCVYRKAHANNLYYTNATDPSPIWRPDELWIYDTPNKNADGTYEFTIGSSEFDFSQATHPIQWKRHADAVKYAQNSDLLEVKDINANYESTKYGYENDLELAEASNTKYSEFTYSGAEDLLASTGNLFFGGEVALGTGSRDALTRHTGYYSVKLNQNQNGFVYRALIDTAEVEHGKKYRACVWINNNGNTTAGLYYKIVNASGAQLGGTTTQMATLATTQNVVGAGNWKLIYLDITVPSSIAWGNYIEIGCTNPNATVANFDDFKFFPLDFPIKANVYNPLTRSLLYTLDEHNFYTRYEYDNFGRQVATYIETIKGEIIVQRKQFNVAY